MKYLSGNRSGAHRRIPNRVFAISKNPVAYMSVGALLLSVLTLAPASPAKADTAGTGSCLQTFTKTGTGDVTVAEVGGYCYAAFKNTGEAGTQTAFSWTRPTGINAADVLVIGGGGSGGARHGGGGGGGSFVEALTYNISSATTMALEPERPRR